VRHPISGLGGGCSLCVFAPGLCKPWVSARCPPGRRTPLPLLRASCSVTGLTLCNFFLPHDGGWPLVTTESLLLLSTDPALGVPGVQLSRKLHRTSLQHPASGVGNPPACKVLSQFLCLLNPSWSLQSESRDACVWGHALEGWEVVFSPGQQVRAPWGFSFIPLCCVSWFFVSVTNT
jgi:hypothetical protein